MHLVEDWHQAWRWSSMRCLALGVAIQGTVVTCPAQVAQHIPEWVWQGLSIFSLACMLAAAVGRVTTMDKPNDPIQHL